MLRSILLDIDAQSDCCTLCAAAVVPEAMTRRLVAVCTRQRRLRSDILRGFGAELGGGGGVLLLFGSVLWLVAVGSELELQYSVHSTCHDNVASLIYAALYDS